MRDLRTAWTGSRRRQDHHHLLKYPSGTVGGRGLPGYATMERIVRAKSAIIRGYFGHFRRGLGQNATSEWITERSGQYMRLLPIFEGPKAENWLKTHYGMVGYCAA